MVRILLLLSLLLIGCYSRKVYNQEEQSTSVKSVCIGTTFSGYQWCKYTNKNDESVCAKVGETSFTVPCEFYDGL